MTLGTVLTRQRLTIAKIVFADIPPCVKVIEEDD
jgi:hypothetical protein